MQENDQTKLLFVINPVSGGLDKLILKSDIEDYFTNSLFEIHFVTLTGKNDAQLLQQQIKLFNPAKVIAVGGDGTIKLVAEQLIGQEIPLGIIPAGSANGLATELGIPFPVIEALDVIVNGEVRKIDLVQLNENEISIHLSDIGLNALLVKYYTLGKLRGKWAYAKAIIPVFLRRKLIKIELDLDGEHLYRSVFMVVIANANAYGNGLLINPLGTMYDGLFEIIIIKEISFWELFKMMFTHRPFDPQKTEIFQAKEISISIPRKAFFQIDGEYRGKVKIIKARILPSAIGLIFPPQ